MTEIWELGELDLEWESMATVMNGDGKPDLLDKAQFHQKMQEWIRQTENQQNSCKEKETESKQGKFSQTSDTFVNSKKRFWGTFLCHLWGRR